MLILTDVLDAAIATSRADFGTLQLLDSSGNLKIIAQRGFEHWWLDYWNVHATSGGSCGSALTRSEPVIVEDIASDPIFAGTPGLEVQLRAGVRACVSVPIVGRDDKPLGMISTHFRAPSRPQAAVVRAFEPLCLRAATELHWLLESPVGRILLVDEDADLRRALREAFEDRGCAVIEASSGRDALHYLTSFGPPPGLVLSARSLPDMHGSELATIVRVVGAGSLPIVLMTASRMPGEPAGAVLLKPVKPAELDGFLDGVVAQLRAAREAPAAKEMTCGACGAKTPSVASPAGDGRQVFCRRCGGRAGTID